MRAVVIRVSRATIEINGRNGDSMGQGLLVLLGVGPDDTEKEALYLADKCAKLRIFEDEDGKMNLSVTDIGGKILAVSQFTLLGDARKGKRPSFVRAARPEEANRLYRKYIEEINELGVETQEGIFRAQMMVRIYNDGPVTILLDSKKTF